MLSSVQARLNEDVGFTLVELLVVILLIAVIGGGVTVSVMSGTRASETADARIEALTDSQQSMQRISREIRASYAHDVPAAESRGPLVVARADYLVADVTAGGTRTRYEWWVHDDGTDVVICESSSASDADDAPDPPPSDPPPTCDRVALPVLAPGWSPFTYEDAEGNCLAGCSAGASDTVSDADMSSIDVVEFAVRRPIRDRSAAEPIELSTRISLRNACSSTQQTGC